MVEASLMKKSACHAIELFFLSPLLMQLFFSLFLFLLIAERQRQVFFIQVLGTEIDTTNLVVMVINGQYVSSVSASSSIERQR